MAIERNQGQIPVFSYISNNWDLTLDFLDFLCTPNLIATPHVSVEDGDAYVQMTLDLVFRNMRRYLAGETLANAVRPELGY